MEKEQTKNQQENQKKSQKLQWHPAFCSALRLELLEDAENLEFTDEFQLTEKPLQIDCTVVKVKKDCKIKNEIGKIFRKHNIFEYKSPMDELNIDTFYKAVAYACLYKVLPNHVDEIPAEEITITLIRDRKPVKLLGELEKSGYGYVSSYIHFRSQGFRRIPPCQSDHQADQQCRGCDQQRFIYPGQDQSCIY